MLYFLPLFFFPFFFCLLLGQAISERVPLAGQINLRHGTRGVSAIAVDPSGARLITGGLEYEVKFFDFAGMNAAFAPFRTIKPCES
jgi:hypothetical protein